jgi:hypothetical protein
VHVHRLDATLNRAFLDEERRDPITGKRFVAGDDIVICAACGSAFAVDSWNFLGGTHDNQSATRRILQNSPSLDFNQRRRGEQRRPRMVMQQQPAPIDMSRARPTPQPRSSTSGCTAAILVVIIVGGLTAVGILITAGNDSPQKTETVATNTSATIPTSTTSTSVTDTAPDSWVTYRDGLISSINEHPGFDQSTEIQTVLREISREQMQSQYVTDENRAFLEDLLRRLGPCNVIDTSDCPAYLVAERASLVDYATIGVEGHIRLSPNFVDTPPDGEFVVYIQRVGNKWKVAPPPSSSPPDTTTETAATDTTTTDTTTTDSTTTGNSDTQSTETTTETETTGTYRIRNRGKAFGFR